MFSSVNKREEGQMRTSVTYLLIKSQLELESISNAVNMLQEIYVGDVSMDDNDSNLSMLLALTALCERLSSIGPMRQIQHPNSLMFYSKVEYTSVVDALDLMHSMLEDNTAEPEDLNTLLSIVAVEERMTNVECPLDWEMWKRTA